MDVCLLNLLNSVDVYPSFLEVRAGKNVVVVSFWYDNCKE